MNVALTVASSKLEVLCFIAKKFETKLLVTHVDVVSQTSFRKEVENDWAQRLRN